MPHLAQQRCLHHPEREAVARCPECAQFYCRECITEHDARVICAECLKKVAAGMVERRGRFAGLAPILACLAGLLVVFVYFHSIGRVLISIPSSFHEGTLWTQSESFPQP